MLYLLSIKFNELICQTHLKHLSVWCIDLVHLCVSTSRRFVFFLDPCNIDIVQRKIKSVALCVSLCPAEELKTYQDLKRFGMVNGELTTTQNEG